MEVLEKTISKNGHGKHSPLIEDFIPVNKIVNEDCVSGMKKLPDACIDLVVTSPPYDSIRDYKGFDVNLHETGKEIFRVLKDGGLAVMVIQDQTKNFGKSLTSFRTLLYKSNKERGWIIPTSLVTGKEVRSWLTSYGY